MQPPWHYAEIPAARRRQRAATPPAFIIPPALNARKSGRYSEYISKRREKYVARRSDIRDAKQALRQNRGEKESARAGVAKKGGAKRLCLRSLVVVFFFGGGQVCFAGWMR